MKKKDEEKQEEIAFNTMDHKDMMDLLVELSKTSAWQAILRFNRLKDSDAIQSLASTDPFKDPTSMARTQGIRIGLYYIEQDVNRELERRENENNGISDK